MRSMMMAMVMMVMATMAGCAPEDQRDAGHEIIGPDGGSTMVCGQAGEACCIGLVNDVPTPICHGENHCDEATDVCTPFTYAPDASPPDGA